MKKLVIFSLASFCIFLSNSFESRLTVATAARLSYPGTMVLLRNKVHDFLDKLKVSMLVDVQSLRSKNLVYQAVGAAETDKDIYNSIQNRFDREFERISRKFILTARELDELEAPVKDKEQFINNLKQEATASIDALLRSYGKQFNI